MTTTTRARFNNRATQTNATHAAKPTADRPAHYRLSVESSSSTTMGHEGEVEVVTMIDLIATHAETGDRFAYVGSKPCGTRDEAVALIAAIFAWERSGDSARHLDPAMFPGQWVRDRLPSGYVPEAVDATAVKAGKGRKLAKIAG